MKIIVILSGGLDSVTMLHDLHAKGHELRAVSFDYGQRHAKELIFAQNHTHRLKIPHEVIDMGFISTLLNNSALTGDIDVPDGHYEDENMKVTVVPNRNMIMASIAVGVAVNHDFEAIALGVHSGDHAIYPDCRPEFIKALNDVSMIANYKPVEVLAPYIHYSKSEILQLGIALGIDYSSTWTCYKGGDKACGTCGSCRERLEAFEQNDVIDSASYENKETQ